MEKIKSICKKIENYWVHSLGGATIAEYLYLFAFAIYMFFYFADTTMFVILWPEDFSWVLRLCTLMIVILKLSVQAKGIDLKKHIFMLFIMTLFFAVWHRTGYVILYDTALLIVGAYKTYYKKILKVYLIVSIPFTIYTIVASQFGLVTNLIYNQHGRIRESFGFIYPTDFAAHIFFMFSAWVLIRELNCTVAELIFMIIIVVLLDIYSDTRCSEITIIMLVLGVLFLKISDRTQKCEKVIAIVKRAIQKLCLFLPVLAATLMVFLCRFYTPSNLVMSFLNEVLSHRLSLGKKIFDYYDIQIWGQYVQMSGNGGKLEKPDDYTFIDCSYINILMRFGILIFIAVILILWVILIRNYKNLFIVGALSIICIHSMIEHHLFEFYYNFFIILPFADFNIQNYKTKKIFNNIDVNILNKLKRLKEVNR